MESLEINEKLSKLKDENKMLREQLNREENRNEVFNELE
jgi:hypothetical protein